MPKNLQQLRRQMAVYTTIVIFCLIIFLLVMIYYLYLRNTKPSKYITGDHVTVQDKQCIIIEPIFKDNIDYQVAYIDANGYFQRIYITEDLIEKK